MNIWISNGTPKNLSNNQIPKYRYLLFASYQYYPKFAMDACVFRSNNFDEVEDYCVKNDIEADWVTCYDVVEDREYEFSMI